MPLFCFVTLCLHYVTFKSFLMQLYAQYAPFFSQTQRSKVFCDAGWRGRLSVSGGLPLCNYHFNEVAQTVRKDHTSHYAAVFFLFSRHAVSSLLSLFEHIACSCLSRAPGTPSGCLPDKKKKGRGGGGGGHGGKESWALMFVFISKTAVKHD